MLNCVAALSLREAARRSILPSPVPVPFPLLPPGRTLIIPKETLNEKKEKQKKRKHKSEKTEKKRLFPLSKCPKICPIFISSCLVCARACYTSHPSTPTHGKHYFFIYFSISLNFSSLDFFSFSFFFFANLRLRRQFADTRSLRCTHCFSPVHTHTVFLNYYVSFFPH